MNMRWLMVSSVLLFAQVASAKPQDLQPAKVLDVTQISSHDGYRTFEVTFRYRCQDKVQGAFLTMLPQPFVTEHTRHVVGIMVLDTGRPCAAADQIEKRTINVPYGDVLDTVPLPLQPRD